MAFAVSAFYTGFAGAMYAHLVGYIGPDTFTQKQSVMFVTMMLFGGTGRLLHASFNGKTSALQIGGKFGLQFSQTLTRINFVGVESPVLRDRHMEKVHMRRLFIHVNHCGNDILRAHKFREKGFALLKKSSVFSWERRCPR